MRPTWRKTLAAACLLTLTATAAPAAASADSAQPPASGAQAQQAEGGLNLVPLRAVAEAIGAEVAWNNAIKQATVVRGDVTLVLTAGEATGQVNGSPLPLGQAARIVENRLQVPLDALMTAFGVQVAWDAQTGKATVDERATDALAFVRALVTGQAEAYSERFTTGLRAALTPDRLKMMPGLFASAGPLQRLTVSGHARDAVHDNVDILARFGAATFHFAVRYADGGQIDDLLVAPYLGDVAPAPAPAYANPSAFVEKEVLVDVGGWPLPATLTLPAGEGPFPAVVLVHGSGPNDRDESIGGIKLFRDLAYGLASQQVAVLRYDKRTLVHPQKSAAAPSFTAQEETIADALAAVKLLSQTEGIDPHRIFVVGHSQGGFFTPHILKQDKDGLIAGGVVLAGPNSFLDVLSPQFQYLGEIGAMPAAQVAFMQQQISMIKDPSFDPAQPPAGFALGSPYYWTDFRGHAAAVAKDLSQPLLLLQGGRDYQVQPEQLQSWQDELSGRENVTYKLYPKLNHFFTEGEGERSTPFEYMAPTNVPAYVIDDIASWIKGK